MGKRSQRKGADGERELAAILREYGYIVERGGKQYEPCGTRVSANR